MSQRVDSRDFGSDGSGQESGSRRKKLAGYLKTANEIRQSYQQYYGLSRRHDDEADDSASGIPGSFPDLAVVRHGDEEMVLFPSYARRLHPRKDRALGMPGASQDIRSSRGSGDSEYWKREWEKYEEENSIVEVDVKGWIYSPHTGAMTRKNRVLVGLARHLSGIPAPYGGNGGTHENSESHAARHDEELVEKQAESIIRRGEDEADIAGLGKYSETPGPGSNGFRDYTSYGQSKTPRLERRDLKPVDLVALDLQEKRASWSQPSDMSPAELSAANAHLMARLKPFLTTPLVSMPLTIFFYNQETSKSRTITTDDSGHFSIRASLDFVPTNIRVLASDKLSATEEVQITEHKGISVISDIDDTIKHSAIGSGAKEIFRNTFIRELQDLHIEGVKGWYSKMADLGAKFHYVSNSPWQLYPVLVTFFAGAGLPKGSFHLKQYSGMLQGIFEPVAERKKGTLEKILQDFPERRFILVGDSGEADLELYTELVLANPGRILGVFIRDVTTTKHHGFFDSSMRASNHESAPTTLLQGLRGRQSKTGSVPDFDRRPALPPRRRTRSISAPGHESRGQAMGTLIDFNAELSPKLHRSKTESMTSDGIQQPTSRSKPSPSPPLKPISLRSHANEQNPTPHSFPRKGPPPLPPKPRQYSTSQESIQPIERSTLSRTQTGLSPCSRETSLEGQSHRSAVRNKVANAYKALPSRTDAYNALPSWHSTQSPSSKPQTSQLRSPPEPLPRRKGNSSSSTTTENSSKISLPLSTSSRRNLSSYPAAAAQYASNRISTTWSGYYGPDATAEDVNGNPINPAINKKEDLWKRRWATAKETLNGKGVLLKSWRTGDEVVRDSVRLIEKANEEDKKHGGQHHGPRKTDGG